MLSTLDHEARNTKLTGLPRPQVKEVVLVNMDLWSKTGQTLF